jgi:hypothetical protein
MPGKGVRTGYGQNWYIEQRLARQARASPEVSINKALEQGPEYVVRGMRVRSARKILSYLALFRNVLILAVSCPYPLTPKQGSEGVRPGEFRKVSYAVLASSESLNICTGRRILMSLLCCRQ